MLRAAVYNRPRVIPIFAEPISALKIVLFTPTGRRGQLESFPGKPGRFEGGIQLAGLDHEGLRLRSAAEPQLAQAQIVTRGRGRPQDLLGNLEHGRCVCKKVQLQQDHSALESKCILILIHRIVIGPSLEDGVAEIVALQANGT